MLSFKTTSAILWLTIAMAQLLIINVNATEVGTVTPNTGNADFISYLVPMGLAIITLVLKRRNKK